MHCKESSDLHIPCKVIVTDTMSVCQGMWSEFQLINQGTATNDITN